MKLFLRQLLLALLIAHSVAAAPAVVPTEMKHPDADGYLRDWLVLAPIFYPGLWPGGVLELNRQQVARESNLHPNAGDAVTLFAKRLTWRAHHAPEAVVDLAAATGMTATGFAFGYVVTYVVSDRAVEGARLRMGTNDLAKVYFNGQPVLRHTEVRALEKDRHVAKVNIKKGVNVLVASTGIILDRSGLSVELARPPGVWERAAVPAFRHSRRSVERHRCPFRDCFIQWHRRARV